MGSDDYGSDDYGSDDSNAMPTFLMVGIVVKGGYIGISQWRKILFDLRIGGNMREEISTETLERCARSASRNAVRRAHDLNIPIVVQQGRDIVRVYANGDKEVVKRLPKAYVRIAKKRFTLA